MTSMDMVYVGVNQVIASWTAHIRIAHLVGLVQQSLDHGRPSTGQVLNNDCIYGLTQCAERVGA